MKIAIDCRSVFPGMGGIGRSVLSLVRALVTRDNQNQYLLIFTDRKQEDRLVPGPNVTEIACKCRMIDEEWEQLRLPSLLESYAIDVYHGMCFSIPMVETCKYVVTIHDLVFEHRNDLVGENLAGYLRKWSRLSAAWSNLVVTVSEYSKKAICDTYEIPSNTVRVIYGAVSENFAQPATASPPIEKFSKLTNTPYVLYVGALEAKKNVPLLLESFRELLITPKLASLQLVLVGGQGGKNYDVERDVSRLYLNSSVMVTGYVSDDELLYLYDHARLFVYPSQYEGFGLPPLEAMSRGIPTIVSDRTSLPEVVGDGALQANVSDSGDLTEKMRQLLTDENQRWQLRGRGKKRAREFSWKQSANKLYEIYRELCKESVS